MLKPTELVSAEPEFKPRSLAPQRGFQPGRPNLQLRGGARRRPKRNPGPVLCKSQSIPVRGAQLGRSLARPTRRSGSSTSPLSESALLLTPTPSPPTLLVQPLLHAGGDTSMHTTHQTKGGLEPQNVHHHTAQGQHLANRSCRGAARTQVCT